MTTNWAYNLDLLAQNGVLDFDAPSFIMNQNPRYVGRPSYPPSPYAIGVPPAPALNQPEIDEFKVQRQEVPQNQEVQQQENKDNNVVHNPSWKKWLFGALAIGGLLLIGFNYKAIGQWVRDGWKNLSGKMKWSNVKTFCSDKWKAVCKFFSEGWDKFKGLFKKKP